MTPTLPCYTYLRPSSSCLSRHSECLEYLDTAERHATGPKFLSLNGLSPGASPGVQGVGAQIQIAASQHCEISLGLCIREQLTKRNVQNTVEIRLCENRAASIAGSTSTNSTHGHKDGVSSAYLGIRNRVRTCIGKRVHDICHHVGGPRRRSDSQSPISNIQQAITASRRMPRRSRPLCMPG